VLRSSLASPDKTARTSLNSFSIRAMRFMESFVDHQPSTLVESSRSTRIHTSCHRVRRRQTFFFGSLSLFCSSSFLIM
jgi:hypothetical protein